MLRLTVQCPFFAKDVLVVALSLRTVIGIEIFGYVVHFLKVVVFTADPFVKEVHPVVMEKKNAVTVHENATGGENATGVRADLIVWSR
jgi:hypothetical protein